MNGPLRLVRTASDDLARIHDRTGRQTDALGVPGRDGPAGAPVTAALLDGVVAFAAVGQTVLDGPPPDDLPAHLERYGSRPDATGHGGERLVRLLETAGETGRGGGHFPVARKWRAVLAAGWACVVVANGAEGEPASAKDAALLQQRPHLVLDGLALAAEALGAQEAVVWLHGGAVQSRRALARALSERRAAGTDPLPVRVVGAPDHYLSGESSAVVSGLSGGPALPRFRRVPAAADGVGGLPTLVQNVETLARVALLARTGATRHRSSLLTVVGERVRSVVESGPDETLADAARRAGAGLEAAPQAVLLGGFGGTWAPWDDVAGLHVDEHAFRERGASLGAGVVALLPADRCGLVRTASLVRYLAASGAGQCGPCVFGLPELARLLDAVAGGSAGRGDVRRIDRVGAEISGRGACHHPDGVVRVVRSALAVFADDVAAHTRRGLCLSGPARPPFSGADADGAW